MSYKRKSWMKTYVGVADCHGVESLHDKATTSDFDRGCQYLRAQANPQRHSVYFETTLIDADMVVINGLMDSQKYDTALKYIKQTGQLTQVPEDQTNSWNLIPNPELDPYA